MQIFEKLRFQVREESFRPRSLGLVSNPAYIIRRALWKSLLEFAPLIRGNVLDFGCGSKPYESLFTAAQSYTGVDIEVSGHEHVNSKVDIYYDGKILPLDNDQFDAVVSFEVFEHVFNLGDILSELSRVTKDSGLLLLSIPFAWPEHEIPYDFARYTSFGITHLLSLHRFDVIALRKTTTAMLAICQLFLAYLESVGPKKGILRHLYQAAIIGPCIIGAYALNAVAPKRYDYFSNAVVLARKRTSQPSSGLPVSSPGDSSAS
jgi:SAM-dependent methyltransferase